MRWLHQSLGFLQFTFKTVWRIISNPHQDASLKARHPRTPIRQLTDKTMHLDACGLDFGTSNSTVGWSRLGQPGLLPLEDGKPTLPSAVFFHA